MKLRRFALCGFALLTACGVDTVSPDLPIQPTAVALEVSPGIVTLSLGQSVLLTAVKRMSDGSRVAINPSWVSKPPDIVSVHQNGSAVAVGIGEATITATIDGLSASSSISVPRPVVAGVSDALVVENFLMIEIRASDTYWFYAPQFQVRAAPGRTLRLLQIDFMLTALGAVPPWSCGANIYERSVELNGEVYGDWALSIWGPPGVRVGSGNIEARITFVDDKSVRATLVVSGKVVAGSMPSTYTGGNLGGACFEGYRPPG